MDLKLRTTEIKRKTKTEPLISSGPEITDIQDINFPLKDRIDVFSKYISNNQEKGLDLADKLISLFKDYPTKDLEQFVFNYSWSTNIT